MDTVTIILSSLVSIALLILIAPSILRRNQGKILRNTALWVAIFLGLALAYKTVGPGRLESLGLNTQLLGQESQSQDEPQIDDKDAPGDLDQGYTPPKE